MSPHDNYLTIAVSKGYLLQEALPYLERVGITFNNTDLDSRKLFAIDDSNTVKLLIIRPWDVPTYVEQGAADLGIAGQDVLLEKKDSVLTLMNLAFGECRLVLAGPEPMNASDLSHNLIVATKYPRSTRHYFQKKGLKTKVLKLYGAIELAPLTGLSNLICDLTATGTTLKEHELHVIDTVFESSAMLIANPVSMTLKYKTIMSLVERLQQGVS